jgi:hypothetical protein
VVTGGAGLVRAAEWQRVRDFAVGIRARAEPTLLTIAGEAGAGKSTLWRAGIAAAQDAGCRVLRSEPSASEAEAPFVGLSDLLSGILPEVTGVIPRPQREALEVALTSPETHAHFADQVILGLLVTDWKDGESGPPEDSEIPGS